jgi:hypothetical protein
MQKTRGTAGRETCPPFLALDFQEDEVFCAMGLPRDPQYYNRIFSEAETISIAFYQSKTGASPRRRPYPLRGSLVRFKAAAGGDG